MPNFFERHSDTITTIAAIIVAFVALVTLNNQRFNAQEKLISQRFDAQDRSISQRFDAQDKSISQRFDAVDQRFDAQDKRIDDFKDDMNRHLDRLTNEVSELRKLTHSISDRVSRNEGAINSIQKQIQAADIPFALNPPHKPAQLTFCANSRLLVQDRLFVQSPLS